MKLTEKEIELYRTYLLEQVKKNHNECVKNGELKYCNNGGFYSEYGCFDDENDKFPCKKFQGDNIANIQYQ